jgi:hypothetical protein
VVDEEFVTVLVPKSRVLDVYALLGAGRGASQAEAPTPSAAGGQAGTYDRALVERAYRESSPKMKLLFDELANHPTERIRSTELAAAIGYDRSQLAGVLGAFGRRWKNRYRNEGPWPFKAEWDGQWTYWMEAEEAQMVVGAREQS